MAAMTDGEGSGVFRVYVRGEHPKPKRIFQKAEFRRRQQARQFCRNRCWKLGGPDCLVIVHPDGREEQFEWRHEWERSPGAGDRANGRHGR